MEEKKTPHREVRTTNTTTTKQKQQKASLLRQLTRTERSKLSFPNGQRAKESQMKVTNEIRSNSLLLSSAFINYPPRPHLHTAVDAGYSTGQQLD